MLPTVALIALGQYNKKLNLSKYLKILSYVLAGLFFFRYMLGSDAIQNMFMLSGTPLKSKVWSFVALFLNWATLSSTLLLILFPFFEINWIKKFVIYFSLPVSILNVLFFKLDAIAILGGENFTLRGVFFALELGLSLAIAVTVFLKRNQISYEEEVVAEDAEVPYSKPWLNKIKRFLKKNGIYIFAGFAMALSVMPAYTVQALFGYLSIAGTCKDFHIPHRIILYIGLVLPFIIHFCLRKRTYTERRFLLLFICLGTLITFSLDRRFAVFADPVKWPLHLCNTAMYLMPTILIFNMKRFYYFTYFINVIGALFAMFMPNYEATTNMFSTELVLFFVNHYIAFFMPILFITLGMFEKPKFKEFTYSMMGFAAYFVLVLILNAVFTGMYEVGLASDKTDFFFINSNFVADKLGSWAEKLLLITLQIPVGKITLTFYPVYQVLFYIVYNFIALAMWFVYVQGFDIAASFADIKRRNLKLRLDKYALEQKLNGRSMGEPVDMENKDKLILNNFSKKYSGSKVYSVKDANLEVKGGEIFGFLGPNGAGKSTIIKSIVGIQPITDGQILVCGYDVETQSIEAKKQIGFVPDHYALYEKLTGREYINYIADLYDVSIQDRNAVIDDLVERFELKGSFDNQIKTYSHGMKQKITIMAALVHDPKVWILDEPLTGLDPNSIFQVKECMKDHAKKGNIVFFSSHIIDVVEKICDRIAIIKKGDVKVCKSVEEIEKESSLEEFYMSVISDEAK